ncbi:hypothetical protein SEA_CECE_227 [Microbacterium phage Cece]|nr:hypothetical protein SEA_CECE_227 [Microbacterium phage Cece]
MARKTFEVVLETALYYSVFVDADDADEAADKVMDRDTPTLNLPKGFEYDERWFVGGVVAVRDDD